MPVQIQKVSITHDAIIDILVARPELTQRELAAMFGYTAVGMGIIVRSDSFKARLEARKGELTDPLIKQAVEDRLVNLAHMSLDVLQRKLETSDDPKLALATLDAAQKSANFGARQSVTMQTQFVVHVPGPAASSSDWSQKFSPRAAPPPRLDDSPSEATVLQALEVTTVQVAG
jgi:hypothetical protein